MKKPNYSGVGYLKHTYDLGGMKKLMKRAVPKLQKFRTKKHFDAIAFRGLSGASIAAILSWDLGIPMMAVRKDGSHDSNLALVIRSNKSYRTLKSRSIGTRPIGHWLPTLSWLVFSAMLWHLVGAARGD
jgi:adenine/guanine phosphoribosyltransferase-like PRPP-binding protein